MSYMVGLFGVLYVVGLLGALSPYAGGVQVGFT